MARKSKLTESQWNDIDKRLLNPEINKRELAREYGVSEAAIRKRESSRVLPIKNVANQFVEAERELSKLPVSSQKIARNYAAMLQAMSDNLLSAAHDGVMISQKLMSLAVRKAETLTTADMESEEGIDSIKKISALSRVSNESATLALEIAKAKQPIIQTPEKEVSADKPSGLAALYEKMRLSNGRDQFSDSAEDGAVPASE